MESISQYHNRSTQELFELLAISTEITASYIKDAADILVELKARKQHHPLMRSALLRYYVDIASGKLSAKAVFVLGGLPNVINKLKGLPIEEQNRIADGGTLPVMEPVKGGLKLVEKPVLRLDKFQLERVFADGRVRTRRRQAAATGRAPGSRLGRPGSRYLDRRHDARNARGADQAACRAGLDRDAEDRGERGLSQFTLVAYHNGRMITLTDNDFSSNELGQLRGILARINRAKTGNPKRLPQFEQKVHADFVPMVTAFRAAMDADPTGSRRRQVRTLLNEYHVDSVSAALNLGITTPFRNLLETWGYGEQTTHEESKGRALEHSGAPALPYEEKPDGLDGRPGEHEGRGDTEASG